MKRFKLTITLAILSLFPLSFVAQTMSMSQTVFLPGSTMNISYSGSTSGTDWFGLYQQGAVPGSGGPSIAWTYVANTGAGSVSIPLNASQATGNYKVVLMCCDGYQGYDSVDVVIVSSLPTLALNKLAMYPRFSAQAYVDNLTSTTDSVAIFAPGKSPGSGDLALATFPVSKTPTDTVLFNMPGEIPAGQYSVHLLMNGQYSTDSKTIQVASPFMNLSKTNVYINESITVDVEGSYDSTDAIAIYPLGVTPDGIQDLVTVPLTKGPYDTVQVTIPASATSGDYYVHFLCCGGTYSHDSTLITITNNIGLNENEINGLKIYPNPSDGLVRLDVSGLIGENVAVFNTDGKLVYQEKIINGPEIELNLDVPTGVYFIKILKGNVLRIEKVMIN